ncbi:hypothetical protein [Kibdelosporangium phytohabitans]|uniref:Glutamine amidotransferase type-2 domain-containing protein n=1 Tax=Kibdelosporangium phytohabitans TaxID=860235 RepID=A0A0N9HWU3_9PSEU|nr:hypothetical protein [Kibdelosporangium phytohabitans]ALG06345.1 hypothetical protein AOZ06_04890 [Kibdelosporangium phytohabitans]MBE1467482.1 glutamine amidotransferase [Kibdelosporangium phytohabitans]
MLTYLPENVMPDEHALANGAAINNNGHGFAIVTGDSIVIERSMDSRELIERFVAARHTHPSGPALFHSRWATAGVIDVANCHPFEVGGSARTVLAHNGIMPASAQPTKRDQRSDTRIVAEDFLPMEPFGPLNTARARTRLEAWLTTCNKVVILTVDPRFERHAYVLNERAGNWNNEIWYSNHDHLLTSTRLDRWDDEACYVCGEQVDPDNINQVCVTCGTCPGCYEWGEYCECVQPAKLRQRTSIIDWDTWKHSRRWRGRRSTVLAEQADDGGPVAV